MSEYVFRTKEPIECCAKCPMCHKQGSSWCQYLLKWIPTNEEKERREDCPLVELPPHGDLIDADKLLPESGYEPMMFKPKYGGDHRTQYNTLMGYEILGIVEDAPTILEASKA